MTWSYDETSLGTSTASERLNSVRFLVGDTDTNDQQVQNEEITFALNQNGDNIYYSASFVARTIASKYARYVDTDLDGQLSESYSDLQEHYKSLANTLDYQGKKAGGGLGMSAGGISEAQRKVVEDLGDRVKPSFRRDQFLYDNGDYDKDYFR